MNAGGSAACFDVEVIRGNIRPIANKIVCGDVPVTAWGLGLAFVSSAFFGVVRLQNLPSIWKSVGHQSPVMHDSTEFVFSWLYSSTLGKA